MEVLKQMVMSDYHVSVMLRECVEALNVQPDGKYVDLTFGAGGHSKSILNKLNAKGHLYSFDQDDDAEKNAFTDERFTFVKANFRYIKRFLRLHGESKVDGILADLGVSSHQLDFPERGFSYRYDAPLDMRMNVNSNATAATVLADYSQDDLQGILSSYGEVRNSKTLAKAIVETRGFAEIKTTFELNDLIAKYRIGPYAKYHAQVYQALRMEVNEELKVLEEMLQGSYEVLKPGGRMVVLTFHSIEDRLVKNFFKTGNAAGDVIKDDFGKIERPWKLINKKVITASLEELKRNSRAKSAKLRIAEKV